jgi:hypothetical protein
MRSVKRLCDRYFADFWTICCCSHVLSRMMFLLFLHLRVFSWQVVIISVAACWSGNLPSFTLRIDILETLTGGEGHRRSRKLDIRSL